MYLITSGVRGVRAYGLVNSRGTTVSVLNSCLELGITAIIAGMKNKTTICSGISMRPKRKLYQ